MLYTYSLYQVYVFVMRYVGHTMLGGCTAERALRDIYYIVAAVPVNTTAAATTLLAVIASFSRRRSFHRWRLFNREATSSSPATSCHSPFLTVSGNSVSEQAPRQQR